MLIYDDFWNIWLQRLISMEAILNLGQKQKAQREQVQRGRDEGSNFKGNWDMERRAIFENKIGKWWMISSQGQHLIRTGGQRMMPVSQKRSWCCTSSGSSSLPVLTSYFLAELNYIFFLDIYLLPFALRDHITLIFSFTLFLILHLPHPRFLVISSFRILSTLDNFELFPIFSISIANNLLFCSSFLVHTSNPQHATVQRIQEK